MVASVMEAETPSEWNIRETSVQRDCTSDNELSIDIGVLATEHEDEYHAQAGKYLSSHLLADFRRCPRGTWSDGQR